MWVIRELRVLLYVLATLVQQILSQIPPIKVRMVAMITQRAPHMQWYRGYYDSNWQVSAAGVPRHLTGYF